MRALHLIDSITAITPAMVDAVIVSGSHGGRSVAPFALGVRPHAVFFNDAGVGKDRAGVAALDPLEEAGMIAIAYASASARIGDAEDGLLCGVVSAVNALGKAAGVEVGQSVAEAAVLLRTS